MTLLESIAYMIWRGIAVGVLISAPMGPVGILCIQRTLEKGRKAGLYTGIGAALSDLVYCLLTGFGLSFVEEFIERHQNVIQLFGSVVLIAFSIYLFRKSPSSSLRRPVPSSVSAKKNIIGGFFFTFSNPLIILLIIGLFARFNFLMPDIRFYHYLIGFIFIFAGALGWWYAVTYIIDKVRKRFSFATMKKINIAIGVVILVFALVGIITATVSLSTPAKAVTLTHWNGRRGFQPFSDSIVSDHAGADGIREAIIQNHTHTEATRMIPLECGIRLHPGVDSYMDSSAESHIDSHDAPQASTRDFDFRFTVRNLAASTASRYFYIDIIGNKTYRRLPPWGLRLADKNGKHLDILFRLNEGDNLYHPEAYTTVVTTISDPCRTETHNIYEAPETVIDNNINTSDTYRFRLTSIHGDIVLTGGRDSDGPLTEVKADILRQAGFSPDSIGFLLTPAAAIAISDITLRRSDEPQYSPAAFTFDNPDSLREYLRNSADPHEGIWTLLDYSLEANRLAKGGDYRLAAVRTDDGYELLYLDGAKINPQHWLPLMRKASLTDTGVPGLFRLTWYDAYGTVTEDEALAQFDNDRILRLQFPGFSSEARLYLLEK